MSGSSVEHSNSAQSLHSLDVWYGVFKHSPESGSATSLPIRLGTGKTWDDAYNLLRGIAAFNIGQNIDWGSTREVESNNMVEIIDSSERVRLRFEIDAVARTSEDAGKTFVYTRLRDMSQPSEEHDTSVHYGMYVDVDVDKPQQKKSFFAGEFKSLGEANHGMKNSASAYLKKNKSAAMIEQHTVQLINGKGEVVRGYRVEKGRLMQGAFMREEAWQSSNDGSSTQAPILRLPSPTPQVTPPASQESPSPQAAPSEQLDDGVERWCTCRGPDDGTPMVGCENDGCLIQWFHMSCIGMARKPPKNQPWWCDDCRPAVAKTKVNKGKGKRQG